MKKHKLLFIFILFTFNPFFSHAQYFDWVERYTGSEATGCSYTNSIQQSVTDKDGNLYFIGSCSTDAGFHNNRFLPMTPYGPYWNTTCLVIGKMSANGDLLWSKIVHENNSSPHGAGKIQLLGDTALVSIFEIWNPTVYIRSRTWPPQSMNYLFYLDTLMTFYVNDTVIHHGFHLFCYKNFNCTSATAYVVFDLDGNIMDEHWITATLLNKQGNSFYMYDCYQNTYLDSLVSTYKLWMTNSHLDGSGNIVITRQMRDYVPVYNSDSGHYIDYYITDTMVGGIRFYVDGKRHFDVQLPDVRPSADYFNPHHNQQILKFSPHFDSLLASQFLFEPTPEHLDTICDIEINDLKCDNDGNIYLLANNEYYYIVANGEANSLKIGGSDSIYLHFQSYDTGEGFLIKYDTLLNPVYLRQFERDTSIVLNGDYGLGSTMWACQFDDDGVLTVLGGASSMDSAITSCFFDTAEVELRKAFIRINPDDGTAVNQAATISTEQNSFGGGGTYFADFVASGNRLIWQFKYRWWLDFAGERYEKQQAYEWGMGFAVWDYDGNELYFVDYGLNGSQTNATRSICLQDSVLYLTGMLASGGAQFGDVTVPNSGSSQSFIARYVDTAFMHPYVRPGSQQDIQLVVRDGEPVVTVYPNPCAQRVIVDWSGDEPPLAATVTDISGRTYSVTLAASGQGRYTVDFSSLPSANYLLTLVTPSGHSVTTRLLKR